VIITAPTGLYKPVLPQGESLGNITYTISEDPPRSNIVVLHLPVAESLPTATSDILDDQTSRAQFGELIFTISNSTRTVPGSNQKTFEVGEVLEFEENPPIQELDILRSPQNIEIQHNTNLLDLGSVGLTESEIESLTQGSLIKQNELRLQFAQKNTEVKDLETDISENQKRINETNKTIRATKVVFGITNGSDNEIFQKLTATLEELETERDQLISDYNAKVAEVEMVLKELLQVSELVR
jgi:hypothetical protein